jgi:integrase
MNMNFETATAAYISSLSANRRRVLRPASISRYKNHATRLRSHFGATDLGLVKNGRVKAYIASLQAEGLTPSTIAGIYFVLRSIVSSVRNEDGDRIYQQKFDADFVNLPVIIPAKQKTPTTTAQQIEGAPLLVKFLAASGLRVSEALSLGQADGNHYDRETGTVYLKADLKNGSAVRSVLLPSNFRDFFNSQVPTTGPLFDTSYPNVHRMLTRLRLPAAHAYRRWRITWLRKAGMNESVIRAQVGHSDAGVTSRYDKSGADLEFVRREVESAGLGFSLAS